MNGWQGDVLIVDDDASFRTEIARVLTRAGLSTRQLASGEEALQAAAERPVAVVLEATLPDVDGLELCHELRSRHGEDLPLIVVSGTRSLPHDRVAGLLIGADDYLVKPVDGDELLVRLRRLLARSRTADGASMSGGNRLSPRELEVLRLLTQGLTGAAIADRLVISRKTVSSHIQRVMAKLGVHSQTQAVAEAYRLGLAYDSRAEPREPLPATR